MTPGIGDAGQAFFPPILGHDVLVCTEVAVHKVAFEASASVVLIPVYFRLAFFKECNALLKLHELLDLVFQCREAFHRRNNLLLILANCSFPEVLGFGELVDFLLRVLCILVEELALALEFGRDVRVRLNLTIKGKTQSIYNCMS